MINCFYYAQNYASTMYIALVVSGARRGMVCERSVVCGRGEGDEWSVSCVATHTTFHFLMSDSEF